MLVDDLFPVRRDREVDGLRVHQQRSWTRRRGEGKARDARARSGASLARAPPRPASWPAERRRAASRHCEAPPIAYVARCQMRLLAARPQPELRTTRLADSFITNNAPSDLTRRGDPRGSLRQTPLHQRADRWRDCPPATTLQSGSLFRTAASVSERSSPPNARAVPVRISSAYGTEMPTRRSAYPPGAPSLLWDSCRRRCRDDAHRGHRRARDRWCSGHVAGFAVARSLNQARATSAEAEVKHLHGAICDVG